MTFEKSGFMFYHGPEDNPLAKIIYTPAEDGVIIATSTVVDPSLRGQGIAKKLLDHLADFARQEGLKIRPECSYVVKAFERYSEYKDVISGG